MCKSVEGINGMTGKALDWARWGAIVVTPFLITALGGLFVWLFLELREDTDANTTAISALSTAMQVMEGNRFTSEDGIAVWRAIDGKADAMGAEPVIKELEEIKAELLRLRAKHE